MGLSVAGVGCADHFGGVGVFAPGTRLKFTNHSVSKYSSCRALHMPASKCSWRFSKGPSWRFLTYYNDRKRGKDFAREGIRVGAPSNNLADDKENQHEIRVCTNRSCRQVGSLQTLDVLRSLAPPNVAVESCGCLSKCGSGPTLVILPAHLVVSHCNTAVHAARLLELQCGATNPDTNLRALDLKERGNKAFQLGEYEQAEQFYSEAIELNPSGGLHLTYGNRSAVRLAMRDFAGALADAEQALCIAPMWAVAHLRKAEAYMQMGDFEKAQLACSSALRFDPSLRRSKSFQAKVKQIAQGVELVGVNA